MSKVLLRYASTTHTPFDHLTAKGEQKVANTEITPHPDEVSTESSVRHVLSEEGVEEEEKDIDMLAGVKSDLVWLGRYSLG